MKFSELQSKILKVLASGLQDIDTIFSKTNIEINELLGLLIELELHGLIQTLPGQKYQLLDEIQFKEK